MNFENMFHVTVLNKKISKLPKISPIKIILPSY